MSRILRRPMFRGGRVSSYGTGIASGLADGGRVNYAGGGQIGGGIIYGKPMADGRYGFAEVTTGGDLLNKWMKGGQKIYGSSSKWGTQPSHEEQLKNITGSGQVIDPYQLAVDPEGVLDMGKYLYSSGDDPTSEDTDVYMKEWVDTETEERLKKREEHKAEKEEFENNPDNEGREFLEFEQWLPINKENEALKEDLGLGGSGGKQILKAEKEPGKEFEFTGLEGDDPSDYDSNDLESMISKYEDLLGIKEARGKDISDMLLSAGSKFLKPGATVKGGFSEFLGEEAKKGPGRGEKIKQAAAMLGIKGEQAQKLYDTKLKNTKGMFTKKVEEIMNTEGVTRSEAIRLALGNEATIGAAYIAFKGKTGMPPTPQEFDMMAEEYTLGPLPEDYKTSKPTGTYYIPGEMVIVEMVEGVAKTKKPYKPQ